MKTFIFALTICSLVFLPNNSSATDCSGYKVELTVAGNKAPMPGVGATCDEAMKDALGVCRDNEIAKKVCNTGTFSKCTYVENLDGDLCGTEED